MREKFYLVSCGSKTSSLKFSESKEIDLYEKGWNYYKKKHLFVDAFLSGLLLMRFPLRHILSKAIPKP